MNEFKIVISCDGENCIAKLFELNKDFDDYKQVGLSKRDKMGELLKKVEKWRKEYNCTVEYLN